MSIDVDLLAHALWVRAGRPVTWDANLEHYRADAAAIAREYDRLTDALHERLDDVEGSPHP